MAASAGRVRLVDESIEDSRDSVKEHNAGKVLNPHPQSRALKY